MARARFYAWLQCPVSDRARDDTPLLELIRHSDAARHGVYGARRVFGDMREVCEICVLHRAERLMQRHKIKAVRGYKKPRAIAGQPSIITSNHLQPEFTVDAPNKVRVTDITCIRTWQGWLHLTVVLELYTCKAVGGSMKATLSRELALGVADGGVAPQAPATCLGAHRPGQPIWTRRLQAFLCGPQPQAEYEPSGQLLGKCRRRALLLQPEEGAHPETHPLNLGFSTRLHRGVLQPDTLPKPPGRYQSRGVFERASA